jgi:hypothetical protein
MRHNDSGSFIGGMASWGLVKNWIKEVKRLAATK